MDLDGIACMLHCDVDWYFGVPYFVVRLVSADGEVVSLYLVLATQWDVDGHTVNLGAAYMDTGLDLAPVLVLLFVHIDFYETGHDFRLGLCAFRIICFGNLLALRSL